MATARVATTILCLPPVFVYSSGDPCGRHVSRHTIRSYARLCNGTRYKQTHASYRTSPNKRFCQRSSTILVLSHDFLAEQQVFDPATHSVVIIEAQGETLPVRYSQTIGRS